MDITTLSKSELIELLYAVTEKAKKKGGKDDDLSTYFTNRTSYKPFKMERGGPDKRSRNLSRNPGAKTPRIMAEDESHDRIARLADVRRRRGIPTMTGVRGKELLDAVTEKGKKKGRGGGDGGPKATGNEPRPSKTFTREAMNRPEGPGNKYSAPQGPDKKGRSMKKSWQWEAPIGKMRGKELFEATEKAKKKSAQPPTPSSNPDAFGKPNDLKRNILQGIQSERKRDPYKMGPNEERNYNLKYTPVRKPSASQKTPRVMPGSRVDINKQNRDAAANQKKATLNKRSDFHAMKVNEAKTKRRKELQTEQAIDQYLSYESEMDDNRQLMFEVITEKGKRKGIQTPPVSKPRKANVYQTTVARDSQASAQRHNQNEAKQARQEQAESQQKARAGAKDNIGGHTKQQLDYWNKKSADYQTNKKREREASQAQTQRLAQPQNTRERRKELQFDGSLVVGAESFFLQMVAATKPK